MKIQSVTVEIHEKRAHPSEMGHYDAKVSYTVEVEDGDDPENVMLHWKSRACAAVESECDYWVASVEHKRKVVEAKSSLQWIVDRAKSNNVYSDDPENFENYLAILPPEENGEWRDKLTAAKESWLVEVRGRLNNYIDQAERGTLSNRGQENFSYALADLPENERQSYRDRLTAALSPKPAATSDGAVQVKAAKPEEELPF